MFNVFRNVHFEKKIEGDRKRQERERVKETTEEERQKERQEMCQYKEKGR
jgi:hypothetical protein